MSKYDKEVGKRYGRWMVTSRDLSKTVGGTACRPFMFCQCDCGSIESVKVHSLWSGKSTSCGCMQKELLALRNTTHGQTVKSGGRKLAPEYNSWQGMKKRCYNVENEDYKDYGGRGIKVCDEWVNSFENFLAHIGLRPDERHSLDRIRVNEDYKPGNVKWSTATEQARNRRTSRKVKIHGEVMPLLQAVQQFGIVKYDTARYRINSGWTDIEAVTTPAQ